MTVIIWVIIAITILVAILFGVSTVVRKKNQELLDELEERREALFDLPVSEEIEEVKKMHMVGQSQNTFREWNQKWTDILNTSRSDLELQIFDIEHMSGFRFIGAKHAIETAMRQMEYMEEDVQSIREGLKSLRESEERNSLAVQEALDVYEELKIKLNIEKESFGNTVDELEKRLVNIEIEFTQFVTLNTTGDPVEARKVLQTAEDHTYDLKDKMERIPSLVEDLTMVFPEQTEEIEIGYKQLQEQEYVFQEDDIGERILHIKGEISDSVSDLESVDLETVEIATANIDEEINVLYDIFEREIAAHKYVIQNREQIRDYIEHAKKNNRQLLIELDHISQSYTLNNNELGRARSFQTEIDDLTKQQDNMAPRIDEHKIAYSQAKEFLKGSYKVLDDIEKQQLQISEDVQQLRVGEKEAQKQVDEYEFKLRNIKRYVEKQRLPGLPQEYLEFFFVSSDRVEQLAGALNKIRINMDEIEKLVKICGEDLELLEQKTRELMDAAALTEQMMQYANRYRHTNATIAAAIDKALHLFTNEFKYKEALDEIGSALDTVESGAFARIENFYFNHRELD